jgi:hypothetical protein
MHGRLGEHRRTSDVGSEAAVSNRMTPDEILRDKLRKIEALFAGATTPGEKAAAGAAAERIRHRLGHAAIDFAEVNASGPGRRPWQVLSSTDDRLPSSRRP